MTLAQGTDQLESSRLVLRRITPQDLPFFHSHPTRSPTSRSISIPADGRARPKSGRMVAVHPREL